MSQKRKVQQAAQVDETALRQHVSALMDDDCAASDPATSDAWQELSANAQARAVWLDYHRIGDWLRSPELRSPIDEERFLQRMSSRLRAEPLPVASMPRPRRKGLVFCAVAAGVGSLALVGSLHLAQREAASISASRDHAPGAAQEAKAGGSASPSVQVALGRGQGAAEQRCSHQADSSPAELRLAPEFSAP